MKNTNKRFQTVDVNGSSVRVRTFAKTAYPFAYPSVEKVRTLCVPLTCENCVLFSGTQKNPVDVDFERLPDSRSGDSWTRTSVPFVQWSPEALGAGFILPFTLTDSGRFRLRRTAHRADASFVCPIDVNDVL